jgi:hypothetical protein
MCDKYSKYRYKLMDNLIIIDTHLLHVLWGDNILYAFLKPTDFTDVHIIFLPI